MVTLGTVRRVWWCVVGSALGLTALALVGCGPGDSAGEGAGDDEQGQDSTESSTGTETDDADPTGANTGDDGPPEAGCVTDEDCELVNDCCTCDGFAVGHGVTACEGDVLCEEFTCDSWGIERAVCRFGACTARRLLCAPAPVACDGLPPACEPGLAARIVGDCYSGECVPVELCAIVESCDGCTEHEFCVTTVNPEPSPVAVCTKPPQGCAPGSLDCACAGAQFCGSAGLACADDDPLADLVCHCTNC